MTSEDQNIFGEPQKGISLRDSLFNYLSNWPLFLISLIVCIGGGIFYSRYKTPKYIAATALLVKGPEAGNANAGDLIESAISVKREVNLNNEIRLLGAASLMENVVGKNDFNISYVKKGRLLDIDIYTNAPFRLIAKQLTDSNCIYTLHIKKTDATGGNFSYGSGKTSNLYSFKWNTPFIINGQHFILVTKNPVAGDIGEYILSWKPVKIVAAELLKELSINTVDSKTSVIQLSLKLENIQKGKDILNALFAEFYSNDIEERSKLSATTVQFIDDRLLLISGELKGVEGNLENYQGSNQLVDIKGQSTQGLENSNVVSQSIRTITIQQGITSMILDYFANPANSGKLVPSSLGLNDATLASLITQYNELQLKRERETPLVAPNSTVMQDLNAQLGNLRSSILESLNNIGKNLKLQESSLQQQNNQYQNFLSSVPHNERILQEIKRKQGITEGLYLYLLQKREEAAISSTASKVAHYKQIDLATGYGPIEPNSRNIILMSALLGLLLPVSIIYSRNLLSDKIRSRDDVINIVAIPVVGEISHIPKKKKQVIPILSRSIVSEQFRAIRTNLSFLLKSTAGKVIMITSSDCGEGKSFISLNMAAVFAIPHKKVALLEFDIRNPVISNNLHIDSAKGLTDFLTGKIDALSEIYQVVEDIPSLHIYPCGLLPVNAADLLQSANVPRLFKILQTEYDYILIDTPPIGLVTDALILAEYADMVIYIVRQGITTKKQLESGNITLGNKNINNPVIIYNDLQKGKNKNYSTKYNGYYN